MKKMMRRILGSALALAMTAGLLSGCGSAYDPVKDVMGYKGSTVMFTVNGRDVTAEEYLFWLAQQADSANMYLSAMDSEDNQGSVWDMEVQEGVTAGDSIKEAAQQYATCTAWWRAMPAGGVQLRQRGQSRLPGGAGHRQGAAGRRGGL